MAMGHFRSTHVLTAEQKLSVQVGHVDGVKVNNLDVAKSRQHKIFEELASNAPSTNNQDLGGSK